MTCVCVRLHMGGVIVINTTLGAVKPPPHRSRLASYVVAHVADRAQAGTANTLQKMPMFLKRLESGMLE